MAVERFVVFDRPGKRVLRERISAFITAYIREAGDPFSRKGGAPGRQLAAMIRQMDYHAICVLLSMGEEERRAFPKMNGINSYL
jgi:hypothetical protein